MSDGLIRVPLPKTAKTAGAFEYRKTAMTDDRMLKRVCPTCGHATYHQIADRVIPDVQSLLDALSQHPDRDVYESTVGTWHVTYTPNMSVPKTVVMEALASGLIHETYKGCDGSYCLPSVPTFDIERARTDREYAQSMKRRK